MLYLFILSIMKTRLSAGSIINGPAPVMVPAGLFLSGFATMHSGMRSITGMMAVAV